MNNLYSAIRNLFDFMKDNVSQMVSTFIDAVLNPMLGAFHYSFQLRMITMLLPLPA